MFCLDLLNYEEKINATTTAPNAWTQWFNLGIPTEDGEKELLKDIPVSKVKKIQFDLVP